MFFFKKKIKNYKYYNLYKKIKKEFKKIIKKFNN